MSPALLAAGGKEAVLWQAERINGNTSPATEKSAEAFLVSLRN